MPKKAKEIDHAPPRFLAAFADFKTDVQVNVGAKDIADFLKPYEEADRRALDEQVAHVFIRYNQRKITTKQAKIEMMEVVNRLPERFELERVVRYFTTKVEEAEQKAKDAEKRGRKQQAKKAKKKGKK